MKLKLNGDWIEYDFEGRVYRVEYPETLLFDNNSKTHIIIDGQGIKYVFPAPGHNGCVLRYHPNPESEVKIERGLDGQLKIEDEKESDKDGKIEEVLDKLYDDILHYIPCCEYENCVVNNILDIIEKYINLNKV